MVEGGVTLWLPFSATLPTVGEMVTVVAFCTCHVSVELCPALMVVGLAAKLTIVGCAEVVGVPTFTAAVAVTEPFELLAVMV